MATSTSTAATAADPVDPIVLAARTVLALQTIVSRENSPRDPAVITVGSIAGGTRYNIIPDEVKLQLTVRSFKPDVRKLLLDGIQRIAKAEAAAANAPKEPEFKFSEAQASTYNDPVVTQRLAAMLKRELGADNVQEARPEMVAEDFGEFDDERGGDAGFFVHVAAEDAEDGAFVGVCVVF